MMAAESWSKYQESYRKYGIDLEPARDVRKERKIKTESKNSSKERVSAKEKCLIWSLMFFIFVLATVNIVVTAETSKMRRDINRTIEAQNEVQVEIDSLNVKLLGNRTIDAVENYALTSLGMIYPGEMQYVYVPTPGEKVDAYVSQLSAQLRSGLATSQASGEAFAAVMRSGNAQLVSASDQKSM